MKKADLKKAIKPLVKECIHEVLLEEGLLSNIVSEVAHGMQNNLVVETKRAPVKEKFNSDNKRKNKQSAKLREHKKRMLDAIGKDAYNGVDLFEGTAPAPTLTEHKPGAVDLGDASDSGVDISSLLGGASQIWNAMK